MKNITFTANESLIKKARERARKENTSLNKRFREWLEQYATKDEKSDEFDQVMKKLSYVSPGKTFTRDEMNER
jgi:hypothetical protein